MKCFFLDCIELLRLGRLKPIMPYLYGGILLFLVLHTEGVFAQGNSEENNPVTLDTVSFLQEIDTSVHEELEKESKPYINPYEKAEQHYQTQPIETRQIDKNNWEKAKSGIDYSDDKIIKKRKNNQQTSWLNGPFWRVFFEILKWFFIIGAVALLGFLIYRFVGEGNIFGLKSKRILNPSVEIDIEHIEENLETADIDPLIKQAILSKNYTLAVRLYYLAILKELHTKGDIVWKKDKTNRTYVNEMREHRFYDSFRSTTSVFERVWYGNNTIDEHAFDIIQPDFQRLLKNLK